MKISLDGRLSVCASLVRKGARLVDVGTDHAYLPVWLAVNGIITSAVACDIREKPLLAGIENIKKYGCEDIVSARLSDGLDNIMPDEADDIVIAGMGAELITAIIGRADWLKDPSKRLILQPMTRVHMLREFLCRNGFKIISETPCSQSGKNYSVIYVQYSGECRERSLFYYYTGELRPQDELSAVYIRSIVSDLCKKRDGLAAAGADVSQMNDVIDKIIKVYGVGNHDTGN